MMGIAQWKFVTAAVATVLVLGGMAGVMVSAVLRADGPIPDATTVGRVGSPDEGKRVPATLEGLIAVLERQRDQVKSLTLETKSYQTIHAEPKVLNGLQRFRGIHFTENEETEQVNEFAYLGGKRYLRIVNTIVKKSDDAKAKEVRRVTYNSERASDGVRVWERRVDLDKGPAQVFLLPVEPGSLWTENPEYCRNFGWDCRTELHAKDPGTLKKHRDRDFLSLLKAGAYSVDPEFRELDGAVCVVLRREYRAELAEYDAEKEETILIPDPTKETIWLDRDRGFAMLRREDQFERWGLERTSCSDLTEILPGVWFPRKTKTEPFAPPDAPQRYQGRPILSWHVDLVRWSLNDVPDRRFDLMTKPGDHLIEKGKGIRVIGDDNKPVDPEREIRKPSASIPDEGTGRQAADKAPATAKDVLSNLLANLEPEPERSVPLRVAIASGEGCNPSGRFKVILDSSFPCHCADVSLADLSETLLASYDVLLIPGGNAEKQARELGAPGRRAVRRFVGTGGGYVGVCAGAKLATASVDWGLRLINAETLSDKKKSPGPDGVLTVDMGKRGSGEVVMELTDAGRKVFSDSARLVKTGFYLGPVLLPDRRSDLSKCLSLSVFRSEVWLHKLQIGTMIDTPSILAALYGRGRVIVFSSHPEGRDETKRMLARAVLATAR